MAFLAEETVSKKRGPEKREPLDERLNLLVSKSWLARADARAAAMGLSLSAYIRLTIERDMRESERRPDAD